MDEPYWLRVARKDLGLRELRGAPTAPRIASWLKALKAWWADDETPWCGVAVAAWMQQSSITLPQHWYRAKGWLEWGYELELPVVGCVVVFERDGGGHVGLVVGKDTRGRLLVLGGNQGDAVSISPFDPTRVAGFRWPLSELHNLRRQSGLPVIANSAASSTNEA